MGNVFAPTSRQASGNYGIGVDGKVVCYCEEKDRSWCSSSSANDNRAVTIECASDTNRGDLGDFWRFKKLKNPWKQCIYCGCKK